MPIANEMQPLSMTLDDLTLLGLAIGVVAVAGATISMAWSSGFNNGDRRQLEAGEKLSTRLTVPPSRLPTFVKVGQHVLGKNDALT